MKRTTQAGFTLLELLVVVIVVGIIATIAVPRFMQVPARAMFAEVPAVLGPYLESAIRFRAENGVEPTPADYAANGLDLGQANNENNAVNAPIPGTRRFNYALLAGFDFDNAAAEPVMSATGIVGGGMAGCTYVINDQRVITRTAGAPPACPNP